jgi:peptidoglycan/xylan/chitin deacetylase (PgdA/CDA1 family)
MKVLISFDIEEFDMPFEYGRSIPFQDQITISAEGTKTILDLLRANQIKATFFSTVIFAQHSKELIHRIIKDGHELASHGYYHSKFEEQHLLDSRIALEDISGTLVKGYRMARMMPVNDKAIYEAGYRYNSSLNPVYLPGRYNNFFKPRTQFFENNVIQLPASATPGLRIPLFWLSFHNFPLWMYKAACLQTMHTDRYLNTYFHPWEFTDLTKREYNLPGFVSRNSGNKMISRFSNWLAWLKKQGYTFETINDFITTDSK